MDFNVMPIQRVLVGLDLTDLDHQIIAYTALISKYFPIEEISFVHITKDLAFPEDMPIEIQQQLATIDDGIRLEIEKRIAPHNDQFKSIKINIDVMEGNPIDRLYRYSKIKNTDIMILGKKVNKHKNNIVNSSLARKTHAQLLLVPENIKNEPINSVLVATDFSEHSKMAVDYALQIASKDNAKVICAHAYSLPIGYTKIGKTKEEFCDIMLQNAEKEFKRFIRGYKSPIHAEFVLDENDKPADCIFDLSETLKPDLVIIGAKGRTNLATAFLGSFAEKMTMHDTHVPLLMVKRRGENMGVFEALLNL